MTKKTLALNEPIVTEQSADGGWVSRLPSLDIEAFGDTHDAAQSAAFQLMRDKLNGMGLEASDAWIETNSSPCDPSEVPHCSAGDD